MLRIARRSAYCLRRLSTQVEQKPKKKFNIYKPEIRMDDLLNRESPLLTLAEGRVERQPLLRSLFVKDIDNRFLTYPEVLEPAQVHSLNDLYEKIKTYVDSLEPHSLQHGIPPAVSETLRSFGVYGMLVPREFGGLGFTATEVVRILEAFATQPSLAATMISHHAGRVSAILKHGTPEQKERYLSKLASGEWTATMAMYETGCGSDASSVETKLSLNVSEDRYLLNGTKMYVTNGQYADVFVVIGAMDLRNAAQSDSKEISAVIVERNMPGVKVEPSTEVSGLKGSGVATVTFENVDLPFTSLLGESGDGLNVTMNVHNLSRVMLPAAVTATAREAMNQAVRHVIHAHRYNRNVNEFQISRKHVAEMSTAIYAMESAVYLTTAIVDVVKDPDFVLEAAATRLFCTQATRRVLDICFEMIGATSLVEQHDLTRWMKDLRSFETFETTPDMCRLLISLSGLQHAGLRLESMIRVARDPLTHPVRFTKMMITRLRDKSVLPKIAREVEQFIHPSLKAQCEALENCMNRLGYAAENILEQYGIEATEHQALLEHLTNVALDVFVLTAAISRASRSYCIGLQNNDEELKLCRVLTDQIVDRVEHAVHEIEYGLHGSYLLDTLDTAEKIFHEKKYFVAHPLVRNWD